MKKCPFCSELIQDDAVKCRYCNEWLEKTSFVDITSKWKKGINSFIQEYKEKKVAHLFIPTNDRPLIIKNVSFYPDRIESPNNVFFYENIYGIIHWISINSVSFITNRYVTFSIVANKVNDDNLYTLTIADSYHNSLMGSNFSKKEFEQLNLAYQLVANESYKSRLKIYIGEIEELGYFDYDDLQIYPNGDIKKNKQFITNLSEEHKAGHILIGSGWRGLKSDYENPYEIVILSGMPRVRIFGLESGNKLKISTIVNHDVFLTLIMHFLDHGKFPSSEDLKSLY